MREDNRNLDVCQTVSRVSVGNVTICNSAHCARAVDRFQAVQYPFPALLASAQIALFHVSKSIGSGLEAWHVYRRSGPPLDRYAVPVAGIHAGRRRATRPAAPILPVGDGRSATFSRRTFCDAREARRHSAARSRHLTACCRHPRCRATARRRRKSAHRNQSRADEAGRR